MNTNFSPFIGSMTILPTVLFLITGVLRETALKTSDNSVPAPVSAALQGIKTIITSPLVRVESTHTQWTELVRSSLASVLEYTQPGSQMNVEIVKDLGKNQNSDIIIKRLWFCVFMFVCISADDSRPDMDHVSMLTAITLFLLSASNELVGVTVLQKGCIDCFQNGLNSRDPWVNTLA